MEIYVFVKNLVVIRIYFAYENFGLNSRLRDQIQKLRIQDLLEMKRVRMKWGLQEALWY